MNRVLLYLSPFTGNHVVAALIYLALFAGNYYLTTLSIWLAHWFSHFRWSPTYEFHVGGHHAIYPDASRSISRTFLYGSGKHDSLFALLPTLLVQALGIALMAHGWMRWALLLELKLIAVAVSWLHAQFHTGRSPLRQYQWFRGARSIHFSHHDRDVNFMVGDHFWDRILRTYAPYRETESFGAELKGSLSEVKP